MNLMMGGKKQRNAVNRTTTFHYDNTLKNVDNQQNICVKTLRTGDADLRF